MQKSVLERFVSKYNLGGSAESVLWETKKKSLETKFITDDKSCLGIIKTTEFSFEDGEYGIYDTAQLRSMLGVLEDDINIKVNHSGDTAVSLTARDATTKATFILSDPSIIPNVPNIKTIPDFEFEFELDEKFISRFVRGKNALPDVETFTIVEEDRPKVIIGYSDTRNTNRISFEVEYNDDSTALGRDIDFSARYMKEILLANKEAKSGKMKVSSQGFAHVSFDIEGFSVDYYLVEIKRA